MMPAAVGNANSAKFVLSIGGYAPSDFTVTKFSGSDAVSAPFSFDIEFQKSESEYQPSGGAGEQGEGRQDNEPSPDILCKPCSLTLIRDGDGGSAVYSGVVRGFGKMHRSSPVYSIRLVPWIELLSLNVNNRVFQKRTVVEIIEEVVQSAGLADHCDIRCKSAYSQIDFCVQYRESDLNFISRLMERDGIWYYFGDDGLAVITDAFSEFPAMADAIPFIENIGFAETSKKRVDEGEGGGAQAASESPAASGQSQTSAEEECLYSSGFGESVYSLTSKSSVFPESVRLRNQNYRTPEAMPEGSYKDGSGQCGRWGSVYEYGGTFKTKEEGDRLAGLFLMRRQLENSQTEGKSRCAALRAGAIIRIKPDIGEFLLISVEHTGGVGGGSDGGEYTYNNKFFCIDTAAQSYAPPLRAVLPIATGLITATVEALGKEHPNVDKVGRYRVKLPFDLSENESYASTKDIRLSQISGSEGYGVHFATKEGGEMLLGYVDGNPDKPVGLGFVPNAKAVSVVNNNNRDQNIIRTWGQNQIVMDDTPQEEKISVSTPKGNRIDMDDKPEEESISVITQGGNLLIMDDKPKEESISIITKGGNHFIMDDEAEKKGVITLATNEHSDDQHILVKAYNAAIAMVKSNIRKRIEKIPGYSLINPSKKTRNSELSLSNEECLAALRAWRQEIALAYNASGGECGITLSTANKLEIAMDDIMRSITLETKRGNALEISDLKNNIVISNAKSITGTVKDAIETVQKVKKAVKNASSEEKSMKQKAGELKKKAEAKAKEAIKKKISELKESLNSIILETEGGKIVLTTASGCKVEIDQKSDSIVMDAPGDITINAGGKLTISAKKDISIRGQENMTITSEKRTAIKGKNDMAVTGTAARIESKGGGVKVHSKGKVTANGASIHLNCPGAKASGGDSSGGKGAKGDKDAKKIPHQDNAKSIFSGSPALQNPSAAKIPIAAAGIVGAGAVAASATAQGAPLQPKESAASEELSQYWDAYGPLYKRGDRGSVVLEINIRLTGFGGLLPTEEFTEMTEKGVMQFQRDYMGLENPPGYVDKDTLGMIDEFCGKYKFCFVQLKCPCIDGKYEAVGGNELCKGFGNGKTDEYPGVHRSVLFALKALLFYFEKTKSAYSLNRISSGYRCWSDNKDKARHEPRKSTNHMGTAIDLHFNKNGVRTEEVADMEDIRINFFCKYMNAPHKGAGQKYHFGWLKNRIGLEPKIMIDKDGKEVAGANTWVHVDVREFHDYKDRKFFVMNEIAMKGEPLKEMLND